MQPRTLGLDKWRQRLVHRHPGLNVLIQRHGTSWTRRYVACDQSLGRTTKQFNTIRSDVADSVAMLLPKAEGGGGRRREAGAALEEWRVVRSLSNFLWPRIMESRIKTINNPTLERSFFTCFIYARPVLCAPDVDVIFVAARTTIINPTARAY
jgi:hypothetical protein